MSVDIRIWTNIFEAVSVRSVMSVLLVFSILLSPYSFAGIGHAQEHQSHSSADHDKKSHHHNTGHNDHSGVGHALTHCGSASCTPSFLGVSNPVVSYQIVFLRLHLVAGDDALRRSLFLESDPPVPRISLT